VPLAPAARAEEPPAGGLPADLLQALRGLLPSLRDRLGSLGPLRALLSTTTGIDGRSGQFGPAQPLLDFLYGAWWRVEPRQLEHVPAKGPVMLVANHGGTVHWDALVLALALLRDHPAHRRLTPLLDERALRAPLAGPLAVRLGALPATPENALRLLEGGSAVAVFPEGSRNALRPWDQRYRVERFGRGGFARLALRSGAPIIPCAIVGSEEASAPVARPGWLADRLPLLASLPTQALIPLAAIPLPSRWSIRCGPPIETVAAGPEAAEDPTQVTEFLERTRTALQRMLDEDLAARASSR